jgi:hypothetical protein
MDGWHCSRPVLVGSAGVCCSGQAVGWLDCILLPPPAELGKLGNTGSQTTGPHLHTTLEPTVVIGTSRARDPLPYIKASRTSPAGGGVTPIGQRKNTMTTLYWNGQSSPNARWALGGDSPGTTANWIETGTQSLANAWAAVHGPAVNLGSNESFVDFRSWYQQPVATSGGGSGGLTAAQNDALMGLPAAIADLPTNGELGQALTSTVALVNEHADENKDEVLEAIENIPNGGSTGGGTYDLSLNINTIPGTATGTATPA